MGCTRSEWLEDMDQDCQFQLKEEVEQARDDGRQHPRVHAPIALGPAGVPSSDEGAPPTNTPSTTTSTLFVCLLIMISCNIDTFWCDFEIPSLKFGSIELQ